MAAINFPSSPSNGDTHVVDGVTYTYNSAETKWKTTINSNAFLPLSGGNVTGNLTVRQDGTGQNIQVWQSDLGVNDRNLALLSPSSDSASEPFTFSTGNSLAVQIDASEAVRIDSSGRVGIGTSSPGRNFQVADSSNAFLSAKCGSVEGFVNVTSSAVNLESSSGIPVTFSPSGTLRGQFDTSGNLQFNSGYGSVATAYGVRAWCNADLTGSGSIRGSGNVNSLTDRGTGRWQFNFTTSMPDANYAAVGLQKPNADIVNVTGIHPNAPTWTTYNADQVGFVYANASGGLVDPLIGNIAVFR